MLRDPRDGLRPPADEHDDHGRAGGIDGLDQLLLRARQSQLGPVARLAAGAVIRQAGFLAHNQDRYVGLPRQFNRLGEPIR